MRPPLARRTPHTRRARAGSRGVPVDAEPGRRRVDAARSAGGGPRRTRSARALRRSRPAEAGPVRGPARAHRELDGCPVARHSRYGERRISLCDRRDDRRISVRSGRTAAAQHSDRPPARLRGSDRSRRMDRRGCAVHASRFAQLRLGRLSHFSRRRRGGAAPVSPPLSAQQPRRGRHRPDRSPR